MTTVFLVQRQVWELWDGQMHSSSVDQTYLEPMDDRSEERSVPECIFVSRKEAEVEVGKLERRLREYLNIIRCIGCADIQIDPRILAERGIVAPVRDEDVSTDYQLLNLWWDEQSPSWTEEQREFVWSLFPQVRFYAIREIPFEG